MTIELFIFGVVIIVYGFFTTLAVIGINRLNQQINQSTNDTHFFSIIVSARNEAANILQFLNQIHIQEFPKSKFELILVDDASMDDTVSIADKFLKQSDLNYRIIKQTKHHGKKQNIALAIEVATGDIVITTDADVCYRDKCWLREIAKRFSNTNCNMLVMPVDFENSPSLLSYFQIFENLALTAITAGYCGLKKPFLCNGANLAFKKEVYYEVNGYEKHFHISSGEDVFLLEEFKNYNSKAIEYGFNRDLIVKTKPQHQLSGFISQRIRWAYKAKYSSNILNLVFGITIMLANLIFLALLVAIIKQSVFVYYLSIFALTKLFFDFLLLFLAASFLDRSKYMILLLPFECIYWFYALTIGVASVFFKPKWKGIKIN